MKLTRHVLIAAGLLVVAVAFIVVRNWDTFALMADNMAAMGEGKQLAQEIRYPDDVLAYIAAHPEDVSLVAYDVEAETEGISFQADRPRPLVKVPQLMLLAEYARRVEEGTMDPARRVPVAAVARYAMPGAGAGRHEQARAHWREARHVDADSTVALRHVADAVTRFGDGAAADWLIAALGREAVDALPARFGLAGSEPPLPGSGTHLSWNHHGAADPVRERLDRFREMPRDRYADRVYRLAHTLGADADFRRREKERQRQRGTDLSVRHQRAFAQATYPRGTAADYAGLMQRVAEGTLHSDSVSSFLQHRIERRVERDSLGTAFVSIGSKAGALPGLIGFVGYIRWPDDRPPRVVALFMEDVPVAVFYHLMQTGLDTGFHLQLLSDDAFFERVRTRLADATAAAS